MVERTYQGATLLVENNLGFRHSLECRLTRLGFTVFESSSVTEAKAILDLIGRPDAVILDLGLGDEDGIDLLNSQVLDLEQSPVVVLTASAPSETLRRCGKHKVHMCLQKGAQSAAVVLEAIKEAADQGRRRSEQILVGNEKVRNITPEVVHQIRRAALEDCLVQIVGKDEADNERVARAFHASSSRIKQSFVAVPPRNTTQVIDKILQPSGYGTVLFKDVTSWDSETQQKMLGLLVARDQTRKGGPDRFRPLPRLIFSVISTSHLHQPNGNGVIRSDLFSRLSEEKIELCSSVTTPAKPVRSSQGQPRMAPSPSSFWTG